MKRCSKCKSELSADCFFGDKRSKDGLRYYCMVCGYFMRIDWLIRNPGKIQAITRAYYLSDPGRSKANNKKWNLKNPEKFKARRESWVANNAGRLKDYSRNYYLLNRDAIIAKCRKWREGNPEKKLEQVHRRRGVMLGALKENCVAKLKQLKVERRCHWCRILLTSAVSLHSRLTDRTIDHVIPLTRGGGHVPDNLVSACVSCNSSKGKKLYWEWDGELAS